MSITVPAGPLILDACSVLTVCASRCLLPFFRAEGVLCYVVRKVREESMFIYKNDNPFTKTREPLDWDAMLQEGLITIAEPLTPSEEEAYVQMAAHMGDGEAASYAVALERGWPVVTDDERSKLLLKRSGATVRILTTPEVLWWWADRLHPDPATVRTTIQMVERCASFRVQKNHYLRDWWIGVSCLGESAAVG